MSAFVDTNVLVRHLTGEPPEMAQAATRYLDEAETMYLSDLIVAELVYVLQSVYEVARPQVADTLRALLAHGPIVTVDPAVLLRTIEVFELDGLDFAEAYLVATAESTGVGAIASFDRSIDRIPTIRRIEPS